MARTPVTENLPDKEGPADGPQPYDTMCLSDAEFTASDAMTLDDVKNFLAAKNSFLRGELLDVDGAQINPAEIIFGATQSETINPKVILTTLQKEQGAVRASTRLRSAELEFIMGYGTPTTIRDQIRDATAQLRRDFDRLTNGNPTAGGWQVGITKTSEDPLGVTPATQGVAILFSYTPWVGERWGGRSGIGGNSLFCGVWSDFGFDLTSTCSNPQTCETFLFDCNPQGGCVLPVCASIIEGGGLCVEGATPCAGLATCSSNSDCPSDRCLIDTCCGVPVCVPTASFCDDLGPSSLPMNGGFIEPTIGRQ